MMEDMDLENQNSLPTNLGQEEANNLVMSFDVQIKN
jgi:hypothetical protein